MKGTQKKPVNTYEKNYGMHASNLCGYLLVHFFHMHSFSQQNMYFLHIKMNIY